MNTNIRKKLVLLMTVVALTSMTQHIQASDTWADYFSKGVEKVKETTNKAYETTRDATSKAYDKTKEVAKDITRKVITKANETIQVVETFDKEAGLYQINTTLNGYSIKNIDIQYLSYQHRFVVTAKKELSKETVDKNGTKTETYTRVETLKRSFKLPKNIVAIDQIGADGAQAMYNKKDGLLTIVVPAQEKEQKKVQGVKLCVYSVNVTVKSV